MYVTADESFVWMFCPQLIKNKEVFNYLYNHLFCQCTCACDDDENYDDNLKDDGLTVII